MLSGTDRAVHNRAPPGDGFFIGDNGRVVKITRNPYRGRPHSAWASAKSEHLKVSVAKGLPQVDHAHQLGSHRKAGLQIPVYW